MFNRVKRILMVGIALPAVAALSACGGGGSGAVSSTPTPIVPPPPAPPAPPPPPPTTGFNTAEYNQSNAAVQAQAIGAYDAGATGQGIIVGVIDSGVDVDSAEFTGRIHPNSRDIVASRSIDDEGGHGTSVSSVLLGARNGIRTHGVAFDATLLALRTDTVGSCSDTSSSDSGCTHGDNEIARGVDLARTTGARVINMSLGGSPANSNLRAAIDRATSAGIIIVISAGNDRDNDPALGANPDALALIANSSVARGLVIIAGAVDSAGVIAPFSNLAGSGAAHYLTALGVRVLAPNETGTQFRFSGTSYSAPVVTGAVALLAQAFPSLTPAQIVDLLYRSATDRGAPGDDLEYGNGELNLANAFRPQGQTSIAGSAIPVSLTNNGSLSTAMGDAAKTGAQAVILDGYGRAFDVDLGGSIANALSDPKLSPSLTLGTRSVLAGSGATGIALSVAQGQGRSAVDQLRLSPQHRSTARALAGSVIARLGRDTRLGLAVGRSGAALVNDITLKRAAAFIAADASADSWGFFRKTKTSFAVAHTVAGFDLSATAETGQSRIWERETNSILRPGYRGYGYSSLSIGVDRWFGNLALSGRMTRLAEKDSVLGARFSSIIGNGAVTWFADARANWQPAQNWSLSASWRQGRTNVAPGGFRLSTDTLRSSAWSFDATRTQLLMSSDQLSVRVSQPLRIDSGGLNISLPTGYDYVSRQATPGMSYLNLTPDGRELDVEAAYMLPLRHGSLGTNIYWRRNPGNVATAPSDIGAAIRFSVDF